MTVFEKIKEAYWRIPFVPDAVKEKLFYTIRAAVKGKVANQAGGDECIRQYLDDLLANQDLNNSFSIEYPKTPKIELREEDPKLLAYYLPQYYPDPHNECWWGKGSTEWTNVSKAVPQYVGQYQPRCPGELGYYDLRIQDNIKRQIELAKIHGIYGFCFYYYWFDGERLLDVPFDHFVNDETIDFPFCISWINESWTKQWSGNSNTPLIEIPKDAACYKRFIESCWQLFEKPNYIHVNGRPVLLIYKPLDIPEAEEVLSYWRSFVKQKTGKDLYLIATVGAANVLASDVRMLFDACGEFAPGCYLKEMRDITASKTYVCKTFYGKVFDYRDFVENSRYLNVKAEKLYRAVIPMWDNTARKKDKGMIYDGATPQLYKKWLRDVIRETKKDPTLDDRFIFINAWNEWAEGTYLEPDLKWQYGYLNATKDAILEARE